MSGTSADGVDVAIVGIAGHGCDMTAELIVHHHRPYNEKLREQIFAFRAGSVMQDTLRRLAQLGREISLTYATAINEALSAAAMSADALAAVAAHGQTLFHDPPNTIQWFDPALVAAEVGCAVISDFRRADLAAGGQGAPLVPFADFNLFRHPTKTRVLLNIGGIANITHIPAGGGIDRVVAFDTGPGNCICDYLCRTLDPAGPGFDPGGVRASGGMPSVTMKTAVLAAPYFEQRPPKSTDGPAMISLFESAPPSVRPNTLDDLLATACLITGTSIQHAILSLRPRPHEVIISGGGTKNACILKYVTFEMPIPVIPADEIGVPSDAKEAIAFALLGAATLDGFPSNVPSATGARRAVVLGSITPKP
jgi:anhydro-N-acetylmuramic acid kinase